MTLRTTGIGVATAATLVAMIGFTGTRIAPEVAAATPATTYTMPAVVAPKLPGPDQLPPVGHGRMVHTPGSDYICESNPSPNVGCVLNPDGTRTVDLSHGPVGYAPQVGCPGPLTPYTCVENVYGQPISPIPSR